MSAKPVFFGTIKTAAQQILPADTTALVAVYTAPANGARIEAMCISSSDTAAHDIALVITKGGVDYIIATFNIPILAGQVLGTLPIDGLKVANLPWLRLDENGNPFLQLDTGCVLKAKSLVTVTAAKFIQFFLQIREV